MVTFKNSVPNDNTIVTDVVLSRQQVSGSASLIVGAINGTVLDSQTSALEPEYTGQLAGAPQLRASAIAGGQIITHGVIPVNVYAKGNPTEIYSNIEVPWQDVVNAPNIPPDADIIKQDFKVTAILISGFKQLGNVQLVIQAVYQYTLIVSEKRMISVNGT